MIGEIIHEKYKIESVFSESHLYEIFTAIEAATGQTVVLKLMKEEMAINAERVRIFSEEVKNFASLSHPYVAEILDLDVFEERPYLVSPFIDGKELNLVMKEEVLSLSDSVKIIQDLAAVLQCAADNKIENRNINLSNVLRRKDGHITVLSFTLPRLKLISSTPVKRSENAGIQADLYFLGTALFELLAGESPIRKMGGLNELWDMKLEKDLRIRHPELEPAQQDKIIDFVRRTLTREMSQRFDNYEDFLKGLADLAGDIKKSIIRNQNSRQMSMASHVVDVLNGKITNQSAISSKSITAPSNEKLVASASLKEVQSNAKQEIGYAKTTTVGNLALAVENTPKEDVIVNSLINNKKKNSNLKLVKSSATVKVSNKKYKSNATSNNEWNEEKSIFKSPVFIIGMLLAVMVTLILFW